MFAKCARWHNRGKGSRARRKSKAGRREIGARGSGEEGKVKEARDGEKERGTRESRGISCVVGESLVTVHLLKELAVLLFQRAHERATTTTSHAVPRRALYGGRYKSTYVLSENGRAERRDLRASERASDANHSSVAASSRSKLPRCLTPRSLAQRVSAYPR